jgi:hypothetical protein
MDKGYKLKNILPLRREDTAIMIAASMLEARGLRVH